SLSLDSRIAATLLPRNARNEQLQESVRVHIDTDFGVWFNFGQSLNLIMIAVQHVVFVKVVTIRNCLAASKVSARLDIDVHGRRLHQCGIDGYTDRQRIVHRGAWRSELRRKIDKVPGDGGNEVVHRAMSLSQVRQLFGSEQSLVSNIET